MLPLELWLRAPKLRADADAPHPSEGRSSAWTGPGRPVEWHQGDQEAIRLLEAEWQELYL